MESLGAVLVSTGAWPGGGAVGVVAREVSAGTGGGGSGRRVGCRAGGCWVAGFTAVAVLMSSEYGGGGVAPL